MELTKSFYDNLDDWMDLEAEEESLNLIDQFCPDCRDVCVCGRNGYTTNDDLFDVPVMLWS